MKLDHRLIRNPDILASEVSGELILMSVHGGHYYNLNTIASAIWNRLAQATRVADLCEAMVTAFEGEPERIRHEVLGFLEQLADDGLVLTATE
jgi:hypothetical protein